MKTTTQKGTSATPRRGVMERDGSRRKLISQVTLLRMRVAAVEATWKEAKEQARQAKRRRKMAKLFSRRAKKDVKTAKAKLDELREALARAEAQAAPLLTRAVSRRIGKAKSPGTRSKKQRSSPRRRIRQSPRATPAPGQPEPAVVPSENIPGPAEGAASQPPAGEIPAEPSIPSIERTES